MKGDRTPMNKVNGIDLTQQNLPGMSVSIQEVELE